MTYYNGASQNARAADEHHVLHVKTGVYYTIVRLSQVAKVTVMANCSEVIEKKENFKLEFTVAGGCRYY